MKLRTLIATTILTLLPTAVFAQGGTTVSFNGITFSAPDALGNSVNIMQVAGDPLDYETPGGPEAKHIEFVFYPADLSKPVPTYYEAVADMRVYQLADLTGYTYMEDELKALQTLLADRPSLDPYMIVSEETAGKNSLAYLPVFPANQVIRAKVKYVETSTLKGIAYLTYYAQDVSPIIGGTLLYTIQGISNDGRYYVSVTMRPATPLLPAEIPSDFNYDQFVATYMEYLGTTVTALNAAPDNTFTPALSTLDDMINTITFVP